ncbi:MAG: hypothetical protein V2I27_05150 [Erythrobacter sp.]|jgi:hypothetical protein|nr:hypothetical protein [Erythrobacter sp.]
MNALWARTLVLMRENFQLLTALGGVFILLPTAALSLTLPPSAELQGPATVLFDPDSSQAAIQRAQAAIFEKMQPFTRWLLVSSTVQLVGYAALTALLGPAGLTVGQAIGRGAKAIVPLILALIVFNVIAFLVLLALLLALSPLGPTAAGFIGLIASFMVGLFLAARLSLTLPVMVTHKVWNPLAGLMRSWRLTAGNSRAAFIFWWLLLVSAGVIYILVSSVAGLAAALAPSEQSGALLSGVIMGCFSLSFGIVTCAAAAAMLEQLTPRGRKNGPEA